MKIVELKVKRLSLAAEARIIRREEKRAKANGKSTLVDSLHTHRTYKVREASRYAHLAHAFLKGTPYAAVEDPQRTRKPLLTGFLARELKTFGPKEMRVISEQKLKHIIDAWELGRIISGVCEVQQAASNPPTAGSTPVAASN